MSESEGPPPPSQLSLLLRSATGALWFANLAVFAALLWHYGVDATEKEAILFAYGAKWNPTMDRGEWWRLVTSTFLHSGFLHISVNMYALVNMGLVLELLLGMRTFLGVYVASGVAGALASYCGNEHLSIGASGAIFGVGGGLVALGFLGRDRLPPELTERLRRGALPFVVVNAAIGAYFKEIDNHAHVGGFVCGLVLTALVVALARVPRLYRAASWLLCAAALGTLAWGAVEVVRFHPRARVVIEAARLMAEGARPFFVVVQKNNPLLEELAEDYNKKHLPKPERAKELRLAVLEMIDAIGSFRARMLAWPPLSDPALRVALADLQTRLVPLQTLRGRVSRFADRTLAEDLMKDMREHFKEWEALLALPVGKPLNAINDRRQEIQPRPAKEQAD